MGETVFCEIKYKFLVTTLLTLNQRNFRFMKYLLDLSSDQLIRYIENFLCGRRRISGLSGVNLRPFCTVKIHNISSSAKII